MTLVQANNAAIIVSVGVGPMFVPSRSLGSSMTVLVRQFPSRMGRAVTMNTLRTGGLLSHNNHDLLPPERGRDQRSVRAVHIGFAAVRISLALRPHLQSRPVRRRDRDANPVRRPGRTDCEPAGGG